MTLVMTLLYCSWRDYAVYCVSDDAFCQSNVHPVYTQDGQRRRLCILYIPAGASCRNA